MKTNRITRKTTTMTALFIFLMSIALVSCQKQESEQENPFDLPQKSAELIEADNAFGLDFFKKVTQQANPNDNTMVSPLSVSLALSMTYNGAEGNTKTEMEKTLRLNGLTTAQINESHKALLAALKSADPDVLLEIANAIYYRQELTVKEQFIATNKNYYDAEVKSLNFDAVDAKDIINQWVAEKTRDKIPEIIDQIDGDLAMILLNAIYFNGIWQYKFDENKTHELPFRHGDGTMKDVATMSQETSLEYYSNDKFSAVHLPYGKGQYRMTVLLPDQDQTTESLIADMTLPNWKGWLKEFRKHDNVVVSMPRFKFAWEMTLNDILATMGMPAAFNPNAADFSGITGGKDLFIGFVKHKTYIDVNENGTEAAAVTAVGMYTTSMPSDIPKKIYFTVDRPFLFVITEKSTGAILFIGEIRAPEYS